MATPALAHACKVSDLTDMPSVGWSCCDTGTMAIVMIKDDGTEVLRRACARCASTYRRLNGDAWVITPTPEPVQTFITRVGNLNEGTVVTITEPGHPHQGDTGLLGSSGRYGSRWVLFYDLDDKPVDVELTPGTRVRVR